MTFERRVPLSCFISLHLILSAMSVWGGEAMKLTSSVFSDQTEIPKQYTCEGRDISPPLSWTNVPTGTKSLALIIDDPDAPDPRAPKRTWVHLVLYNISPDVTGLSEGLSKDNLPRGTLFGINDFNRADYGGPCPPIGRHRYFHKLYALDVVLPDLGTPTKERLWQAMQGHILVDAVLLGTYQKR
jgi:Raf kinase inhibitor-like YbhB/YbcL family protein